MNIAKSAPSFVKIFFLRALTIFIAWKLLYCFILKPSHFPDEQLTKMIVVLTAKALSLFYNGVYFLGNNVFSDKGKAIGIGDACNGLEVMMLYCGFIFAMPTIKKNPLRKAFFIFSGILSICLINIVRCTALSWIHYSHPMYFPLYHKYVFNFIAYSIMISGWVLYCKDKRYVP